MASLVAGRRGRCALTLLAVLTGGGGAACAAELRVEAGTLPAVAKVDERFQSYNVEMAEVLGGRFWAPYRKPGEPPPPPGGAAAAMFRKREPIDLKGDARLQALARALGPAYLRVSGGWANKAWFQDDDAAPLAKAPDGFEGVLTRAEWAGVVGFARRVDAEIVTSFDVGPGSRGADGVWKPDQARRLVDYTQSLGGRIYAAELINEPNVGPLVGLPKDYTPKTFALDQAAFRKFIQEATPQTRTVGPGSTGEAGFRLFPTVPHAISTEALLSAEPRATFDIFSYHAYGAVSERCAPMGPHLGISADDALSEAWLARTDAIYAYYKALHDRFEPGTPIWLTETAEAACGGDRWAASFLDTFRYVDQMGRLAKKGVAAVFHNTLGASDYALIDDATGEPRPSYWAAVLWRRLMGTTVLDAGPLTPGLHLYAQCLRGRPGGVALVALNLDRARAAALDLAHAASVYRLSADALQGGEVRLNGQVLRMTGDELPPLDPVRAPSGRLALPPASITFVALPGAGNRACA